MAHHKRQRPKHRRAGCLLCKPSTLTANEEGRTRTDVFLYSDGLNPVAELGADNSVRTRFVYATRAHVPDYMLRDDVAYRFVTDQLGSVRLVVNSETGEVVQELKYDEFGQVTRDTNPGFQAVRLRRRHLRPRHRALALRREGVRPRRRRWTAKDRIDFDGGDPTRRVSTRARAARRG